MATQTQVIQQEQPRSTANAPDSGGTPGIGAGGIPEEINQLLKDPTKVDPQAAELVRKQLESGSRAVTQKMQKLTEDVQLATTFRTLQRDPDFAGWLDAYSKRSLADFYRQRSGAGGQPHSNAPTATSATPDNPQGQAQGGAQSPPSSDPVVAQLRAEIETLKAENQGTATQLQTFLGNVQAEKFAAAHPDWQNYAPEIAKVMGAVKGLSLEQALVLAKAGDNSGSSPVQGSGGGAPTPTQPSPVASPPPSSLNNGQGVDDSTLPKTKSIRDAFAWAKEFHGVR